MSSVNASLAAAGAAQGAMQRLNSGVRVVVDVDEFLRLLDLTDDHVVAKGTLRLGFRALTWHTYVFYYEGFAVFTTSREELALPQDIELIRAKRIQ